MADEEATAVNEQVEVQDTTNTESAPVETKTPEVEAVELPESGEYSAADVPKESTESKDDTEEQSGDDDTSSDQTAEDSEDSDTEDEDTTDKPLGKAEKRKQQLDQEIAQEKEALGIDPSVEIRSKVELRNHLRELNQVKAREAQVAAEQELLGEVNPDTGEYFTPAEAERVARQQTLEQQQNEIAQERYSMEVQQNQRTIAGEVQQALTDFPIFNDASPEYDSETSARVERLLESNLIRDPNTPEIDPSTGQPTGKGQIIGSNVSPYELLQTVADSARSYAAKGQVQGQKATEKMLASADNTGSSQQGEPSFNKLSVAEMAAKLRAKGHDV